MTQLNDFPLITHDKVRYADTDRQGHVNNAVFNAFLETGRVEILYNPELPILTEASSFVIAQLNLDFKAEIKWPGQVDIGTGISKIGNSSLRLTQALFQDGAVVAEAQTVIVHISNLSKKGTPLSEEAKKTLSQWIYQKA